MRSEEKWKISLYSRSNYTKSVNDASVKSHYCRCLSETCQDGPQGAGMAATAAHCSLPVILTAQPEAQVWWASALYTLVRKIQAVMNCVFFNLSEVILKTTTIQNAQNSLMLFLKGPNLVDAKGSSQIRERFPVSYQRVWRRNISCLTKFVYVKQQFWKSVYDIILGR